MEPEPEVSISGKQKANHLYRGMKQPWEMGECGKGLEYPPEREAIRATSAPEVQFR